MVFLKHLGSLQKVFLLDLLYMILGGRLKEISLQPIFKEIFTQHTSTTEHYQQQRLHKTLTRKKEDLVFSLQSKTNN